MKKTLLKIKNNITFEDKLNAIDLILNSFWDNDTGEYIPWMEELARIVAVGKYFIEGYELEDGENLYKLYLSDNDLKGLIDNFINPDYTSRNENIKQYIKIMKFIDEKVHDKLEWEKQNIIHANPDMDRIVKGVNVFIDAFENLANLDLTALTPDMIENGKKFIDKLKETDFDVSPENLTKIVKDAANFDIDKASKEIIETKNDQIKKLEAENKELKKEKFDVMNGSEEKVSGGKTSNRNKKK